MFRTPWFLLVILVTVTSEPGMDQPVKTPIQSVQPGQNSHTEGNRQARCYVCSDCQKVFHNTTVRTCPYDNDYSKRNKCVSYVERYKYLNKPWYVRGCASERGSCNEIRRAHEQTNDVVMVLNSCNECKGDKCNGGSRSISMAFLSLVVTPIIGKLALS